MTSALQKILDRQGAGLLSRPEPAHSAAGKDVAWMSFAEDGSDRLSLSWNVIASVLSLHTDET